MRLELQKIQTERERQKQMIGKLEKRIQETEFSRKKNSKHSPIKPSRTEKSKENSELKCSSVAKEQSNVKKEKTCFSGGHTPKEDRFKFDFEAIEHSELIVLDNAGSHDFIHSNHSLLDDQTSIEKQHKIDCEAKSFGHSGTINLDPSKVCEAECCPHEMKCFTDLGSSINDESDSGHRLYDMLEWCFSSNSRLPYAIGLEKETL